MSKVKILIITPTEKEFDFFSQGCTTLGFEAGNSVVGRLPVVQFPDLGITLARGGAGKAQFAVQALHLLDACMDWNLAICAGAAGGLVEGLSIGDVVEATTTVEHDYNNKFSQRSAPKFEGAQTVIAALQRAVWLPNSFRVHFGVVASGDEDVIETQRRRTLQQSTGALVVAWEGAGGARACVFSNVPFVEIRGVTDTANHNAASDYEMNLEVAMSHVARVVAGCFSGCSKLEWFSLGVAEAGR